SCLRVTTTVLPGSTPRRGQNSGTDHDITQALADLLADRSRVLGKDHPQTLTTRNNLAAMLAEAGDAAGAAQALTDLLESMARVLGEDHPHLPIVRRNLDHCQQEAEKMPESGNDHS
ncbi:tetratricopeptide repeat protein, partial [Streptomyces lavendulae]